MENTKFNLTEEEYVVDLGPKDGIYNYTSKWPIFLLHTLDQKGIWLRLKTKLDILEYQKQLQELSIVEIEKFFYDNLDIAFETDFFEEFLPGYEFFKYKNKVYCYTTGKKGKDKVKIYCRFYFDLEDIIKN